MTSDTADLSLPRQFRQLAAFVEAIEDDAVTVADYHVPHGATMATVTLDVDLAAWDSPADSDPTSLYADEVVAVETDGDAPTDRDDGGGPDVAADDRFVCDEPGCDFASDSERGLNIHQARAHDEDPDDDPDEDPDDGPDEDPDDGPDEESQVWCGICGSGPFDTTTALAGHHAGAGHDGDTEPVDAPPDDGGEGPNSEGVRAALDGADRTLAELADALAGAQSLRTFARDLDVDREVATTVAGRLGVIEQLAAGGSGVGRDEAEALIAEVAA